MLPWSVMPMAGCPSAAAAATTSSTRAAPSSIEYSVWTWRWVKLSPTGGLLGAPAGVPQSIHSGRPPAVDESHGCDFDGSRSRPALTRAPRPVGGFPRCPGGPAGPTMCHDATDRSSIGTEVPYGPGRDPAPAAGGLRVQNLLLGLGTGLLAVAAVVFTAVNWDRLDAGLQAVALLVATGVLAAAHGRRGPPPDAGHRRGRSGS